MCKELESIFKPGPAAEDLQALKGTLPQAAAFLARNKVDSPRLSAELIIAQVLGVSRLELLFGLPYGLGQEALDKIRLFLAQRARGCPMAYLLGRKEFYGLEFEVTPDVLIPRPETELILDLLQKKIRVKNGFLFADLGTGCGSLGIALLKIFPESQGILTDISPEALKVAQRNSQKHRVQSRVQFVLDDLGSGFKPGTLDLAVANPPYLSSQDMLGLSREIKNFEPKLALWGGPEGYEKALNLICNIWSALKDMAWCFVEAAPAQLAKLMSHPRLARMLTPACRVYPDLNGKDRILALQKVVCKKNNRL